jgi:pimeloyl-ACP methyl ester carboxylesterase
MRAGSMGILGGAEVRGKGSPVVVFESGAGEGKGTWNQVQDAIAQRTTTFAYSRSAFDTPLPLIDQRDGESVVNRLKKLLNERGLKPPYVLVGHSLGGLYMQYYAKKYPDEVAGLVLVDPTTEDQIERMREELPGASKAIQAIRTLHALDSLGAEIRAAEKLAQDCKRAGAFPRKPVFILTATLANPLEGQEFLLFKHRLQGELVQHWPGAIQKMIHSRHYIQTEKPDEVVQAISAVLETLKEKASVDQ